MKNKKGFTLVELLAVIVILAILATAAFTLVIPRVTKARKDVFFNEARSFLDAANVYFLEHPGKKCVNIGWLIDLGYASVKSNQDDYSGAIIRDNNSNLYIRFSKKSYNIGAKTTNSNYNSDYPHFYDGELKYNGSTLTNIQKSYIAYYVSPANLEAKFYENTLSNDKVTYVLPDGSTRDVPKHAFNNFQCSQIDSILDGLNY